MQGCQEPTAENVEVVENLEECLAKCDVSCSPNINLDLNGALGACC